MQYNLLDTRHGFSIIQIFRTARPQSTSLIDIRPINIKFERTLWKQCTMKVIYVKLKNRLEREDTMAAISCLVISLMVFFIIKVLNREIPL